MQLLDVVAQPVSGNASQSHSMLSYCMGHVDRDRDLSKVTQEISARGRPSTCASSFLPRGLSFALRSPCCLELMHPPWAGSRVKPWCPITAHTCHCLVARISRLWAPQGERAGVSLPGLRGSGYRIPELCHKQSCRAFVISNLGGGAGTLGWWSVIPWAKAKPQQPSVNHPPARLGPHCSRRTAQLGQLPTHFHYGGWEGEEISSSYFVCVFQAV